MTYYDGSDSWFMYFCSFLVGEAASEWGKSKGIVFGTVKEDNEVIFSLMAKLLLQLLMLICCFAWKSRDNLN